MEDKNGMDSMISILERETKEITEKIINDAFKKSQSILSDAKQRSNAMQKKAEDEAKMYFEKLYLSKISSLKRMHSQKILSEKQRILDETIKNMRDRILSLNKDEYFSILEKSFLENIESTENMRAKVTMRESDINSIPQSFKDTIKNAFLDVKFSSDNKINGGMAVYCALDDCDEYVVEYNLRIEELINEKEDNLKEYAAKYLFD